MQCPKHSSTRHRAQGNSPAKSHSPSSQQLLAPGAEAACSTLPARPECRGNAGHSPLQNRPCLAHGTGGKCFWSLAACEAEETGVRWEQEESRS